MSLLTMVMLCVLSFNILILAEVALRLRKLLWHSPMHLLKTGRKSSVDRLSVLFLSRPRSEGWPHHDVLSPFTSILCHSD